MRLTNTSGRWIEPLGAIYEWILEIHSRNLKVAATF
jgi:hypothetical protein